MYGGVLTVIDKVFRGIIVLAVLLAIPIVSASVTVDKSTLVPSVVQGNLIEYHINVSNTGSENIAELNVTDTFDANALAYSWAVPSPGNATNGSLYWKITNVQPNTSFMVVVRLNATLAGNHTNNVTVLATNASNHTYAANDSATVEVLSANPNAGGGGAGVNASITKRYITAPRPPVNDTITFEIEVNNTLGPGAGAQNVSIVDQFDASVLNFTGANVSPTLVQNGALSWNVTLPENATYVIQVNFTYVQDVGSTNDALLFSQYGNQIDASSIMFGNIFANATWHNLSITSPGNGSNVSSTNFSAIEWIAATNENNVTIACDVTLDNHTIATNISVQNNTKASYQLNASLGNHTAQLECDFNDGQVGVVETETVAFTVIEDEDLDGIEDALDTLIGTASDVTTTGVGILKVLVDNQTAQGTVSGLKEVVFKDGSDMFMSFFHDFSGAPLNLSKVSIVKSSSGLAVNLSDQLASDQNKTLYVEDNNFKKLCVKNAPVASLSDISDDCDESDEIDFKSCLGKGKNVTKDDVTCYDDGETITLYNLKHSGVLGVKKTSKNNDGGGHSGNSDYTGGIRYPLAGVYQPQTSTQSSPSVDSSLQDLAQKLSSGKKQDAQTEETTQAVEAAPLAEDKELESTYAPRQVTSDLSMSSKVIVSVLLLIFLGVALFIYTSKK